MTQTPPPDDTPDPGAPDPGDPDAAIDDSAPGWDAIDRSLRTVYGDQTPQHWGTLISYRLGGPDPLPGLSAYDRMTPVPHWHYVSYGFSDLYESENPDPDVSGYGMELTLRLYRPNPAEPAPTWPLTLLQSFARYVFETGNVLRDGDHMAAPGMFSGAGDTALTAAAFVRDRELPEIDGPLGKAEFRQVIGLTDDEYQACQAWNTRSLVDALLPHLPWGITDPARGSLLPRIAAQVAEGVRTEGSSTGVLYLGEMTLDEQRTTLHLRANEARLLAGVLPGRLPHQRPLSLQGASQGLALVPGETVGWGTGENGRLELALTPPAAAEFVAALGRGTGRHPLASVPGLALQVTPEQ